MKTRILNTILTSILLFISLATINAQVTTVTLNPSQDAIIISNQVNGDPASEYFSCGIGKTGRIDPRTGQLITTTFEIRSLMLFDLSDIPANAIILSANLSLYSTGHGITTPGAYLQPVIQPWTQLDVSWSNQPEAVGTGQVFLDPTAESSQDYTLDVSFFVDLWIKGVENDGFMFRIGEGYLNTCSYNFASSDYPDNTMFPKLEVSWVMPIELSFNVTDGSAQGTKSITTTITGGVPPYSVEWDSGERMANLSNTQPGIHIIYVSDATGEEKIFSISTMENYPVVWSDFSNTEVIADTLKATFTADWSTIGAASINKIESNTDGGIKYSFAHVQGADFISFLSFGLSETNTNASDTTIEYSFRLNSVSNRYLPAFGLPAQPSARIFESGIWVEGTEIPLNEGAVYEITRTGNTINYIINSIVVHQTTTDPNKSLIADVSLLNPNNWIAGVEMTEAVDPCITNPLTVNAGADISITTGQFTQLGINPISEISYHWYPFSGLNSVSISNPLASPQYTTTYTITATANNGCVSQDIVVVTVQPNNNVVFKNGEFGFEENEILHPKIEDQNILVVDIFNNIWRVKDNIPNASDFNKDMNNPQFPVNCGSGFILIFEDIESNTNIGFDDPSPSTCTTGLTLGQERVNTVCEVVNYIASVIDIGNATPTIYFNISENTTPAQGALGTGTPLFLNTPVQNNFEGGFMYEHITTGVDPSANDPDAIVFIDFGSRVSNGLVIPINSCSQECAEGEIDLYSVLLHEITHSMGFVSFIASNGTSSRTGSLNGPYSRFDRYLLNNSNTNLVNNIAVFNTNASDLISNTCVFYEADNSEEQPLYTPLSYIGGSSMSHFDNSRSNLDYVMKPSTSGGSNRFYTQAEIEAFEDIGYTINNANIPNLTNYPIGNTDNATTIVGSQVCIDILSNDIGSNGTLFVDMTCGIDACTGTQGGNGINILSGGGTATIDANNLLCYTPSPNFVGTAHLQYCLADALTPQTIVNASNPVDVYITVNGNFCPDDPCNFVCNGGFEYGIDDCGCLTIINDIGAFPNSVCDGWYKTSYGTPDLLIRNNSTCNPNGCSDHLDVNSNYYGNAPTHNGIPNNRYIGLICGTEGEFSEGVYAELVNTLTPGKSYSLSIWVYTPYLTEDMLRLFLNQNVPNSLSNTLTPIEFNIFNNGADQISGQTITAATTWYNFTYNFIAPPNNTGNQYLVIEPSSIFGRRFVIDDVRLIENLPTVTIAKNIVAPTNPLPGDNITYNITVNNTGTQTANNLVIEDILPPDLTFVSSNFSTGGLIHNQSTLNAGNSINLTLTANIPSDVLLNTPIQNCVEATSGASNCQQYANGDNCATFEIPATDIIISKTFSAPTPIILGTVITYTVNVFNAGSIAATNVLVNDLLPASVLYQSHSISSQAINVNYYPANGNLQIPLIDEGESIILIIKAVVDNSCTIINCANLISLDQLDTDFSNNSSCVAINSSTLTISVSNTNNCGNNCIGTATATSSNGTSPYSYIWSNNQTTQTASNLCAGIYSVTVTDANTCTGVSTATITDQNPISISTTKYDGTCSTMGRITVIASGGVSPYTYSLDGWTYQASNNFTGLAAGNYIITVKDANGCTKTSITINITQPSYTTLTAVATQPSCLVAGGIIDLTATGATPPYTYLWSNNSTTEDLVNVQAGVYSVTVTPNQGCAGQYTTTLTHANDFPVANFTVDDFNKCEEELIHFNNTSNSVISNYLWDFGDPISSSNTSTIQNPNHIFSYPGYYHVKLNLTRGFCSNSKEKDIYIVPSINNYNPSNCVKLFSYNKPGNTTISASDNWTTGNYQSGKITIQGALIIEPNVTLTVNGVDLNFGPEGKIIIKEKGTLNLTNTNLTSIDFSTQASCGCPADMRMMWQGIEVWGNGYSSSASVQGKLNINSGVTIEDSYYGIVLGKLKLKWNNNSNYQNMYHELYKGGILNISPATFNRNYSSINIFENKFPYPASSSIHGCNFICQTNDNSPTNTTLIDPYMMDINVGNNENYYINYHYPFRKFLNASSLSCTGFFCGKPYSAIYLNSIKDVRLYDNYFDNSRFAMESYNSNFKFYKATSIMGNVIKNTVQGIYNNHSLSTFYGSSITDNTFSDTYTCIQNSGGIGDYYKGNIFNGDPSNTIVLAGLSMFSSSFKIVDNIFNDLDYGIVIENSDNGGGFIGYESSGNQFNRCKNGLATIGNNINLKIKCNLFNNNGSTIYLSNWEIQGLIADQGKMPVTTDAIPDVKEPAGNRFNPNDPTTKKDLNSSTTFNYFYHGANAANNPYEPVEPGGIDNISLVPTPVPSTTTFADACIPYIASNDPIGTDAEIDLIDYVIDQAQNDFNNLTANLDKGQTSMLLDAITSNINAGKLKNMLVNASPLSDNVLIEVINCSNPLAPGLFKDVLIPNSPVSDNIMTELKPKLNSLPAGIAKQILDAQGYNPGYVTPTTLSRLIKYNEMERQLLVNNLVDYYVNNDLVNEAIDLLEGETTQVAKQILTATYIDMENTSLARAKLNSLDVNTQDEIAFYNLYSMYIDLLEAGKTIYEPDSAQLQLVREIAGLCPSSLATVNAQALLSYLFNEHFEPCNDSLTAKSLKLNIPVKSKNQLYLGNNVPNPFKNTTKIPYSITGDITAAYIEICDLTGKPVKKYDLSADKNILDLSLDDLGNGVYSYSLIVNGIRKATKQMVLIK